MNIFYKSAFILFFTIIGAGFGHVYSSKSDTSPVHNTTLFVTILSSDEESSIEEKETASHFFAEAVLGWTLSPAFKNASGVEVSSRKQERGNIIFEINSSSAEEAKQKTDVFYKTLESKINAYNIKANTQFQLLKDEPQTKINTPRKSILSAVGGVIGFFVGLVISEAVLLWRRKKS